jgi:hypothetical protein
MTLLIPEYHQAYEKGKNSAMRTGGFSPDVQLKENG